MLIARALDDLDFKTIADQQGIPISTAHDRYQRGIAELKAAYARHQRKQVARGLVVMPFTVEQLLTADRTIPDAPAELVRDSWSRVERALRWQARWRALRSLIRRPEAHLAATFLAGGVLGAVLHAAFQSTPHPAPVVFGQRSPLDAAIRMVEKNHVSVRLDPPTLARVKALIPLIRVKGRQATRSDVLRVLIASALERNELPKVPEQPGIDTEPSRT